MPSRSQGFLEATVLGKARDHQGHFGFWLKNTWAQLTWLSEEFNIWSNRNPNIKTGWDRKMISNSSVWVERIMNYYRLPIPSHLAQSHFKTPYQFLESI